MQKHKIMFRSESMHEDEINQYKNFDALLAKNSQVRKQKLKTWIWTTLGISVAMAVLGYMYQQNPTTQISIHKPQQQMETPKQLGTTPGEQGKNRVSHKIGAHKQPKPEKSAAPKEVQRSADVHSSFVEASPAGGYEKLFEYLRENCQYPDSLVHTGISGTVLVQFTINKKGKAEQITVVKRLHPALDKEAIRAVAHMPLWTPASIDGKPLDTKLTLPLTFQNK